MENFASILERDYGFKSGKNAPMVSGSSGGSGGGGGSYGSSGLRKSVPSSRMSTNAGVFGSQDDPFSSLGSGRRNNVNSNNEGSRSSRASYGSRDDLFTPAAYDDVFGGPPKSSGGSESGARYDDVFGGAPQGGPVYDDLLGGFGAGGGGGATPTMANKSASGSFHSSPRRSDRNHFASSAEPAFDELLPGFGFLPKSRVSAEVKGSSHQNSTDPFADPLTSTSGLGSSTHSATTALDDDSLLPGFESATSKSRSYSGGDSNKSSSSSSRQQQQQSDPPMVPLFDDPVPSSSSSSIPPLSSSSPAAFDDDGLIPGFGGTEGVKKSRSSREAAKASSASVQDSFLGSLGPDEPPTTSSIPSGSSPPLDDPFNVFSEPQVNMSSSRGAGTGAARGSNGVKVDRYDSFDSLPQSPANSSFFGNSSSRKQQPAEDAIGGRATSRSPDEMASAREGFSGDDISGASPDSDPFFPSHMEFSGKSAAAAAAGVTGGLGSSDKPDEEKLTAWDSPTSDEPQEGSGRGGSNKGGSHRSMKDLKKEWLTIDDLKLMTQPSPFPPARRPPPLPGQGSGSGSSFRDKSDSSRDAEFVPSSAPSTSTPEAVDVMGGSSSSAAAAPPPPSYQEAVPGWMDFKIQPNLDEEKEREEARAARERRRQERDEARAAREAREKEREAREKEMKEREARQAREQERLRRDKEREKDRAAVRIATLEARERAAQEAREKAERSAVDRATGEARERAASQARMRVERAAVDRANAEARERAEVRAAVEKAQAEARERAEKAAADKAAVERAAAEARERSAQKAAAERAAVERAQSEARERAARAAAEKAAVERAAAEARERAERAAAEKAAAARERERAQQNHRKSENDLESFFGHSSTSSETRRPASMNNSSNVFGGEPRRTTSAAANTAASVDDWTTIFGATPSSDDLQRGDTKVSRGKSDRVAHTRERAAKAIAEINQRDLELQREQAEKQRAGDVLDAEIKRWAAGKEGNLRALLSTLQYVLWPECGWTAVSLTDLINPTAVKKTYRKATLYVHPDKVQQKGATVQQKYIAEKVFDLLKEASNKFNSEELF